MKYFFTLLTLLLPITNLYAQLEEGTAPSGLTIDKGIQSRNNEIKNEMNENNQTGLQLDSRGKKVGVTPEWSYTYLRFAQSSVSFFEKEKGSSLSFGHRQVADSFYYDLQYNTLNTNESKTRVQSGLLGLGWQASWNHRLLPYMGLQLGYSSLNSSKLKLSDSGIYTGIDAGVILKRYYPFLFILGTRFGIHNYSNEKVKNVTTQEAYLAIGIEAF